eukprot:COSAG02_NODE_1796_length_10904_cov_23.136603_5_plen_193_part_00
MAANWRNVPLAQQSGTQASLRDDPSVLYRQFASSVTLNGVHSDCRRCIWIADAYRLRHALQAALPARASGQKGSLGKRQEIPPYALQDEYLGDTKHTICDWVAVRERGAYRFVRVQIPQDDSMTTVEQLQHRAVSAMRVYPQATAHGKLDDPVNIAMIYTLWGREVLDTATAVASLSCGMELELVLVPPAPL